MAPGSLIRQRRGPAARQDGELAQPYRVGLGQPAVAALDRANSPAAGAGPLRRARQRPERLETRRSCRSRRSSTTAMRWSKRSSVEQFDLLAISQGAAVAIAYAVRNPERVRKLVICSGYAARLGQARGPGRRVAPARGDADADGVELGDRTMPPIASCSPTIMCPAREPQADGLVQRDAAAVGIARECRQLQRGVVGARRGASIAAQGTDADVGVPFARATRPCRSRGRGAGRRDPGRGFVPLESATTSARKRAGVAMFSDVTREFLTGLNPLPVRGRGQGEGVRSLAPIAGG